MSPHQYREVLIGLDRALFVFHEAHNELDRSDHRFESALAGLRTEILRLWAAHRPSVVNDDKYPAEAKAPTH